MKRQKHTSGQVCDVGRVTAAETPRANARHFHPCRVRFGKVLQSKNKAKSKPKSPPLHAWFCTSLRLPTPCALSQKTLLGNEPSQCRTGLEMQHASKKESFVLFTEKTGQHCDVRKSIFFGLWSKSAANLRLVPQCAHENSLWSPGGPFSLARPWLVPLTICRSPSPSSTWAWQRSRPARYAVARYFSRRGWSLARRSCEEVAFQCKFELCGGEGVSPEFNHSTKKTKKTDGGS